MAVLDFMTDELTERKQTKRDGVDLEKSTNARKKKRQSKKEEPIVTTDDLFMMFKNLNTLFKIDGSPPYDQVEDCMRPDDHDILAELVLGRDSRHDWESFVKAMVSHLEPDTDLENIMSWIVNKSMDYIETTKNGKKLLIPKIAYFYRIFEPYLKLVEEEETETNDDRDNKLLLISLALSTFLMYIFNTKTLFLDVFRHTNNVMSIFTFVEKIIDKALERSSEVLNRAVVFILIWYQRYFNFHRNGPPPLNEFHERIVENVFKLTQKLSEEIGGYPSIPSYCFDSVEDRKRKIMACQIHMLANLTKIAFYKEDPREIFKVPKTNQVSCNLENWVHGTHLGWTLYQLPYKFKENCFYYFEVYILTGGSVRVGFLPRASSDYNGENPGELEGACLYDANEKVIWVHQRDEHAVGSQYSTRKGGAIVGCLLNTFSKCNEIKVPENDKDIIRTRFHQVEFYLNGVRVEEVNPAINSNFENIRQLAFFDRPFSLTVTLAAFQQAFVMLRPEQWQFAPVSEIPLSFVDLDSKDLQLNCLLMPTITSAAEEDKSMLNSNDDGQFHECVQINVSDVENDENDVNYPNNSKSANVLQYGSSVKASQVKLMPTVGLGDFTDSDTEQTTEVEELVLNVEFKKMTAKLWSVQGNVLIIKDEFDLYDCLKSGGVTKFGKYLKPVHFEHDMYKQPVFLNRCYQVNNKVDGYKLHKKNREYGIGPFYFRTVTDLASKQKYENDKKEGKEKKPKPLFTFTCCVAGSLEKMIKDNKEAETRNKMHTENVQNNEEIFTESNIQNLMHSS